jgi:hypothetical protein
MTTGELELRTTSSAFKGGTKWFLRNLGIH